MKPKSSSAVVGGATVYGIPNCDSVKKARTWLSDHAVTYQFHNFKKQGVTPDLLAPWLLAVGWHTLVNRKGTTWRKLDAVIQASVVDAASATAVILANASVIKRPLVVWADGSVTVGFSEDLFAKQLRQSLPG
jgi:Spx/MgsR family transcriptional regulator